jgi:histidine triad (HIT) family protein
MYNHQPKDEPCAFCIFASGEETSYNKRGDVVYEDDETLAFISPLWWVNNTGHVLVIPKKHFENIYDIPDDALFPVHATAKKIALAIRKTYQCNGVTIIQHNEPAGTQDIWHYHVHIFPRFENDNFYENFENRKFVSEKDRKPYAEKLCTYFQTNK